jgi:hypothetical protein
MAEPRSTKPLGCLLVAGSALALLGTAAIVCGIYDFVQADGYPPADGIRDAFKHFWGAVILFGAFCSIVAILMLVTGRQDPPPGRS